MKVNKDGMYEISLYRKQYNALDTEGNEVLYGGSLGSGKSLSCKELLKTTTGWKRVEDVHPGDYVFGEDGKPTLVVAESEKYYEDAYEVFFDDGSSMITHKNHEWYTQTSYERTSNQRRTPEARAKRRANRPKRGKGKRPDLALRNATQEYEYITETYGGIRTTEEIKNTIMTPHGGQKNHAIPVAKPLEYPEKDLPLDPYTLGLWLGDGSSASKIYACHPDDHEILDSIAATGFEVLPTRNPISWKIENILPYLRKINVFKNKHIPDGYKTASYTQRLSLVQGLMDSDGTIDIKGNCELCLSDETLANDALEVIRSLGIKCSQNRRKAYLYGVRKKDRYRMSFTTTEKIFRLKRKVARLPEKTRATTKFWYITKVVKVENTSMKCIQVDNTSHLYLAGKNLIPTHNSFLMRYSAIVCSMAVPGLQTYIFRRKFDDLKKNHLFGTDGFMVMLDPFIKQKLCTINFTALRIDFSNGSQIHLCHCQHDNDRFNYQGAQIHFLMIDELTHFSEVVYRFLRTRVRLGSFKIDYSQISKQIPSATKGYFPRILCGTNPGGVGGMWVKQTWIDPAPPLHVWDTPDDEGGMKRVFVPAFLSDNTHLLEQDPNYAKKVMGLGDPNLVKAMLEGDWDVMAGGALDDVWHKATHVIEPFKIPHSWYVDRTMDWGSAAPYAIAYWAESDGSPVRTVHGDMKHYPRGTVFQVGELYGWDGKDLSKGTKESARKVGNKMREYEQMLFPDRRVAAGAADGQIFEKNRAGIAESIHDQILLGYKGVDDYGKKTDVDDKFRRTNRLFYAGNKNPGSRVRGLELIRSYLEASKSDILEEKCLFFFNKCVCQIATLPMLPRDERNPEDVATDSVDHLYDALRYRIFTKPRRVVNTEVLGI